MTSNTLTDGDIRKAVKLLEEISEQDRLKPIVYWGHCSHCKKVHAFMNDTKDICKRAFAQYMSLPNDDTMA